MSGVRCVWMRGGTSKGGYFLAEDLPGDLVRRDAFLLSVMGSPDERQIDGMGGGHPLTSKVAVVSACEDPEADVDYLFLQVAVDEATVSDKQNCGNILAGVAPFAIERGLVPAADDHTEVRIRMVNTGGIATARVSTPGGEVNYRGDDYISGVPNPAAGVLLEFADTAGSSCGSLLPTGKRRDVIAGVAASCVDNGMPVVVLPADELGITGYESPQQLESHAELRAKLEEIRRVAGDMMGLGDVTAATVPKLTIIAPPRHGGTVSTRTFIPHRCHASIGVLGAVSVATVCALPGTVAPSSAVSRCRVEHPSGHLDLQIEVTPEGDIRRSGVVRTARKLFDGHVFAF